MATEGARPRGGIVWFTGLSGAGKSTLATALARRLAPVRSLELLDGDDVRTFLSAGLGFSRTDRDTNVHRIAYVARLLASHGVLVLVAAISPYREVRRECREMIGEFVEVFVKCPVEVCAERDVKGLYKKALAGEIPHFTGVSEPYDEPEQAAIVVETNLETPEQSAARIIARLEVLGYLDPVAAPEPAADEDEDDLIRQRLEELGYV